MSIFSESLPSTKSYPNFSSLLEPVACDVIDFLVVAICWCVSLMNFQILKILKQEHHQNGWIRFLKSRRKSDKSKTESDYETAVREGCPAEFTYIQPLMFIF